MVYFCFIKIENQIIMKRNVTISIFVLLFISIIWATNFNGKKAQNAEDIILQKEKEALTKWGNRNVWGYLNLFAKDATYFDTGTKFKLKGYEAIESYIAPWNGKIYVPDYKMTNVDVKVDGNVGVLTYNVYNFNEKGDTTELWNSTEIYRRTDGDWKIIHSHWSLVNRKQK